MSNTTHFEQTIHIEVNLSKDDRQRLDELIALAGLAVAELKNPGVIAAASRGPQFVEEPAETQEEPEQPTQVNEHPVDEVSPHELPEPAAEPEQTKYTKADILAKVQKLAGPNNPKREQAKAIVKSYGAKVSDIPEDKYAEVMERLTALEG